ncbi:g5466 [Coccomyxa elongata]
MPRSYPGADNDKGPLSIQFYLGRQGWNAWEGREADGWYKGRFGDVDDMPGHCCVIIGAYHGDEWQAEHKGRGSFIVLRDPIGEGRLWDQGHVYIPFELLAAVDRIFCVEPSL